MAFEDLLRSLEQEFQRQRPISKNDDYYRLPFKVPRCAAVQCYLRCYSPYHSNERYRVVSSSTSIPCLPNGLRFKQIVA